MKARCDVCLGHDVQYTHYTEGFKLDPDGVYPGYDDDGAWGLCPSCHHLAVKEDEIGLFTRHVLGAIRNEGATDAGWAAKLIKNFLKFRTGQWVEDMSTVIGDYIGKDENK